ncbi:hypothetical protein UREG_01694 [Uncinocarpus reesii 1704]|uniref:Oxysterol-binding protein n=1 Tax=Uncinocarpus reesii (strain UAMH 1704) TaxID=336963 RepID=C4JJ87_UNCRE|nr:uncharacterized protein UREG_01694 [Uncinocarpus reesii 1704]EEP76845.1 hypothetical protein UREG_01694 [Uncinocarpus reesii 1704]
MLPKLALGHHGHQTPRRSSLNSARSDDSSQPTSPGAEDETVVEPDQGNVLSHIISQLRPGADLSRVVLPTFILEPRSMLERITKGVKKPLNPILGEVFTCYWEYPDNSHGYYISEQTSHHPPKSSYFFMVPEHHIRIDGTLKPRSRFLGNSAASMMEGIAILQFLNRGKEKHGERYILTQPNMYARGILFGKMKYELGDHSYVRCPENNLVADVEFKTKGYFMGTYNAIGGTIKNEATGEVYYELSGYWNGEMYIKDVAELLFNATTAKHSPPIARPLEEQQPRESQKLWHSTTQALLARNHELATEEKTKIEDRQREEAAQRADRGVEWRPRLFRRVKGGPGGPEEGEEDLDWILNAHIDSEDPKLATRQILAVAPILKGQEVDHQFDIPPHCPSSHRSDKHHQPVSQNSAHEQQTNNLIDFGNDGAAPGLETGKESTSEQLASSTGHPIQRRDSHSSGVDEFVDAQD